MSETPALRWEPFQGDAELAMIGDVQIGMITPLAADPATWAFSVDGINVKWMTKRNGHVRGKASARRAVNRAWAVWAERAGLTA